MTSPLNSQRTLGILVGGGPAPGINGVIAAATIEAINSGLVVLGIYDGFKWLAKGDCDHIERLQIHDVSRIYFSGGSILRSSRVNPIKSEANITKTCESIRKLGLNYLITIGGDDTAFAASQIARQLQNEIKIAHIPKTIDNDLPLPKNIPTFGFETAKHVGAELVHNLMEDARTTNRWYIIVSMGRKSGHLTLGIAKAAGAHLAIIGEQFSNSTISIHDVCDILEGAIIKRKAMGRDDGIVLIAEGVADKFSHEELKTIPGVIIEYDEYGNIHLSVIDLGKIIKLEIERRFAERGEKMKLVDIDLGYVLRSASPIAFDREYTRDLGCAAVRFLVEREFKSHPSAMVSVDAGKIIPINFEDIIDQATGKIQVRMVDTGTESYAVAQKYMIRLNKSDFADKEQLSKLAKIARMTTEQFTEKFGYLAGI